MTIFDIFSGKLISIRNASSLARGVAKLYSTVSGNNTDGTSDQNSINTALSLKENLSNKATDFSTVNNTLYPSVQAVNNAINNAIAGVNPAVAVQAATTTTLPAYTYNNGVSGIGAFITITTPAIFVQDGFTFTTIGQRLLVKNEVGGNAVYNGVYYVSVVGTGLISTILIRALDYDQPSDINNTGAIPVVNGTINGTTSWVTTSTVNTVGTDAITYTKFSINPSTIESISNFQNATEISFIASGTDTYTATPSPVFSSYTTGMRVYLTFTNANTGAATINLNGLGAKAIKKSASTALSSGDISAGQTLILSYDGTNFQVIGGGGGSTLTKGTKVDVLTLTEDTKYLTSLAVSRNTIAANLYLSQNFI